MVTGSPFRTSEFRRIVDVETGPVDERTWFDAPKVGALFEWWRSTGGGHTPTRAQFDVTEHPGLVANLFLVDRTEDDFVFRVRGEEVLRLLGGNDRGRTVSAHRPDEYRHFLNEYYARILDQGVCYGCRGTLAFWNRPNLQFESVDCPLTDAAGAPRFIIGAIQSTGLVGDR